ncbi:MAG: uroporphyrinogen-III synthase [Granulosicoccus sp.]
MQFKDTARLRTPRVLITRPEGQQLDFSQGCEALGYSVALLPCLQIVPCKTDLPYFTRLLDTHGTALFTSANAVQMAHRLRPLPWPQIHIHAIGAATAHALDQYQQKVALIPQAPYNSEAYLKQLADTRPGSLLIIKGIGGRDLILPRLQSLGWQVSAVALYERLLPDVTTETIDTLFTDTLPDIVSVTSNETLSNLWQLCRQYTGELSTMPLVVNSQRCAQLAADLGFKNAALIAEPAGNEGQLSCLAQWKKQEFDPHY